jgi:hypothetical protein
MMPKEKGFTMPRKRRTKETVEPHLEVSPTNVMGSTRKGNAASSTKTSSKRNAGADYIKENRPAFGNRPAVDIQRTYTRIIPSNVASYNNFSIMGASGYRAFTDYPYDSFLYPDVDALIVLEYDVDWQFGVTTDVAGGRVITAVGQIYNDVLQYIQNNYFVTSAQLAVTSAQWLAWLNNVSSAYCTLRALQSIMECPGLNTALTMVKNNVVRQRIAIEADLDLVLNYGLPPKIYEYLDALCGVKQKAGHGTVKWSVPGVLKDEANGTAFNYASPGDLSLALAAVEAKLANLEAGAAFRPITDAMRLAYGLKQLDTKDYSTAGFEYDMQALQMIRITNGGTSAPNVPDDEGDYGILAERNCSDYTPQYVSIFRTPTVNLAGGVQSPALLTNTSATHGTNGWVYDYGGATSQELAVLFEANVPTVVAGVSLNYPATAANSAISSDSAKHEFPWVWPALEANNTPSSFSSFLDDYAILASSINDVCEETIHLLRNAFATGLRPKGR